MGRDAKEAFNGAKREAGSLFGGGARTIADKTTFIMVETQASGQSSTPSTSSFRTILYSLSRTHLPDTSSSTRPSFCSSLCVH